MPRPPFRRGDEIELRPDAIGDRGEATGAHEGWEVRVPGGIPDEPIHVRIEHLSRGAPVAWGRPSRRPPPSELRRVPECRIHDECGGCGLQHFTSSAQERAKVSVLAAALESAGVEHPGLDELMRRGRPFRYRNRTVLWPEQRAGRLRLGARPPKSADKDALIDTSGCAVLLPSVEATCALLRRTVDEFARRGQLPLADFDVTRASAAADAGPGARPASKGGRGAGRGGSTPSAPELQPGLRHFLVRGTVRRGAQVTVIWAGAGGPRFAEALAARLMDHKSPVRAVFFQLHSEPGNALTSNQQVLRIAGPGPVKEQMGKVEMIVPPSSFLQANPVVASWIYQEATTVADVGKGDLVVDLYCGTGGLSLMSGRRGARIVGVDRARESITLARRNARSARARHAQYDTGDVEAVAHTLPLAEAKVVMMNPPRRGAGKKVIDALAAAGPARIIYLSCSPDSLAQDLVGLGAAGYRITRLTPIDLMPHTPHLEVLAVLER